jgi:hypothetical protein
LPPGSITIASLVSVHASTEQLHCSGPAAKVSTSSTPRPCHSLGRPDIARSALQRRSNAPPRRRTVPYLEATDSHCRRTRCGVAQFFLPCNAGDREREPARPSHDARPPRFAPSRPPRPARMNSCRVRRPRRSASTPTHGSNVHACGRLHQPAPGVSSAAEARAGLVPTSVFKTDGSSRERRIGGFDSLAFPPTYAACDEGPPTGDFSRTHLDQMLG